MTPAPRSRAAQRLSDPLSAVRAGRVGAAHVAPFQGRQGGLARHLHQVS